MIVVPMGVSGCGKTTVGRLLASSLSATWVDADDLHSEESKRRMANGIPLTDAERRPWLRRVRQRLLEADASGEPLVLACSALKSAHRSFLRRGIKGEFHFVHLRGTRLEIARRLALRKGHFMPPDLLNSQFDDLEEPSPGEALIIPIGGTPESIVATLLQLLSMR